MINSMHIVWKFLSLQVEIKYLSNTQRLTSMWPLSLFLQDNNSFSNSSHMFHSFKLHAHLVHWVKFSSQLSLQTIGNQWM